MTETGAGDQPALFDGGRPARPRAAGKDPVTQDRPVALVQVDTGLAHLDRPFEYTVPESMAAGAQAGTRVKVRFAGQDLGGWVLGRRDAAEHPGRLTPLRRLVSPEPVLTPEVLDAARGVASRYAGTLGDVLRLAVPPRHARAEQALPAEPPPAPDPPAAAEDADAAWAAFPAGPAFLARLRAGDAPAASVLALPAVDPARAWPGLLAAAVRATVDSGRGALVVVPDHRDVTRAAAALEAVLGPGRHVRLTADQGPQARYTAFLKALRGHVPVVVGTRAAAFAPVRDLGLVAWWDDGDDLLDEPRAPYPHVREVLLARAAREGSAVLAAGYTRTAAVADLVGRGVLRPVEADRATVRAAVAPVRVAGEGADLERDGATAAAHLPSVAWRAAKEALATGPVLVQVPRRGYLPSLSCQDCRRPARCRHCAGPLALTGPQGPPACRWCGRVETAFACPACSGTRLRSSVVGARRTAEELGRAFPGVPVERSGAGTVLERVEDGPRLVVSTPGAEPVAPTGYAAALLLDAWALLDRPTLDAGEEALRRWCAAAALVRPGGDGGRVVLAGAPTHVPMPAVEALVRWDPAWFADRELTERRELALPPTARLAALTGTREAVTATLGGLELPPTASSLGPLPHGEDRWRALVTVPVDDAPALARELAAARAHASARKATDPVTVRVDPRDPTS
ncbi:primosomal protein N' family DNA-binding protein [Phycicoccus flavus]|uniref:Probable replication restart protein PriA n=1 Tax=Phycicoccus flavus TaxID=2502783 RepID=A0A8T6R7E2_9MICO|nr:primosome assembly protein PriA [Phycicoccus flavus]NHA69662.1 primosome assembly protein PriA [Phycicoccus flavus]